MFPYFSLGIYVLLSFIIGFFTSSLRLSGWLLQGLHSYVSPEKSSAQEKPEMQGGNGYRSMKGKEAQNSLNDEEGNTDSNASLNLKRRDKKKKDRNKEKSVWEEGNSQIFRVNLVYSQFSGRLYFPEFDECVVYAMVGVANLLAHECLCYFTTSETDRKMSNYEIVPFLMGLFAVCKICLLLARVSWQSNISRMSELILSFIVGSAGFLAALYMIQLSPTLLGFDNDMFSRATDVDFKQEIGLSFGSQKILEIMLALIAGFLSGVLVIPAHQSVRSFWLGTDQLQWNIPVLKWSVVPSTLLYLNVVLPLFISILWIKPLGELFIASGSSQQGVANDAKGLLIWGKFILPAPSDDWAQDFGVSEGLFKRIQFWGLLFAGLLQVCLFRVNVQSYLNEAVFVWYEGLHRSKVVNLDLTRAKLLLNNYLLCRAAVHFFAPGIFVTLLLGMSRVWSVSSLAESPPTSLFFGTASLFLAWWITFSWSIITCVILALYRFGFLLAS